MTKLSIVILSYNTKDLLLQCLASLQKVKDELDFDVIVIDNASIDKSAEIVEKKYPRVKIVKNEANLGFAKGNNIAREIVKSKYVLFLNSDTIVKKGAIAETFNYLQSNHDIGAMTCRVLLTDGKDDPDTRRSFPTPWVSLTHFSKLDRLFPRSKIFAKYWRGYEDPLRMYDVDVIQGAFFMSPRKVLDQVGWFSEEYFLDGEDIDLCWKIKKGGYRIVYYPEAYITHIKKASKSKSKSKKTGVESMEIFYRKNMWSNYPLIVNILVIMGIKILRVIR